MRTWSNVDETDTGIMVDVIQDQLCDCNGVQALMRLLVPAQMDHGEEAMVNTAAKLLSIIQEKGRLP